MQREAIHDAWVPAEGAWSLWAKPVLFAQMKTGSEFWLSIPTDWAPPGHGEDRAHCRSTGGGCRSCWSGPGGSRLSARAPV